MLNNGRTLICLLIVSITFTTCKKYPEGGLQAFAFKHLLTDNNDSWKLKLYEVNGIDSTYLINAGGTSGLYSQALSAFKLNNESKAKDLSLRSGGYFYEGYFKQGRSQLLFNCVGQATNPLREIFNPEKTNLPIWVIDLLKKDKVIFTAKWDNFYKIILEK
ncbi:MAG: hypothetical protein IAF38_01720 [Bacteroidia bacterium]|nr:hypothetical protein [Bacteroidia bacterium]